MRVLLRGRPGRLPRSVSTRNSQPGQWLLPAPPKKLVYTSSTSVYGQTDGSLVTEASPVEPASETGRVLVEPRSSSRGGAPEHSRRSCSALPESMALARGYWFKQYSSGAAVIEGKGERLLNMIHQDDVAGAIIAALQGGRLGQIYNAVDDEPVGTQLDFFQWLSGSLDRPLPPFVPEHEETSLKRGVTSKRISNLQLKSQLGYCFKYPTFREGYAAELARLG